MVPQRVVFHFKFSKFKYKLIIEDYRYAYDSSFSMLYSVCPHSFINSSIWPYEFSLTMSLVVLFMLPDEDSDDTGENQITDLHLSISRNKSEICLSSVTPESSLGV